MSIATINPATGETVKTFTPASDSEVEAAIARAHDRFLDYRHSTTFLAFSAPSGPTPPPTSSRRKLTRSGP